MPSELEYTQDVAVGARGTRARRVQEWLTLHGLGVVPDGKFGAATAAAVRAFQKKQRLRETGVVNRATFEQLVARARRALAPIAPKAGTTLGALTVAYARQHLAEHPREVGGANRGPWVRLYMDGNEGDEWLWCAGFATYVLRQAAETLGQPLPVARTFSCDELAGSARKKQCFCAGNKKGTAPMPITPGSLFLSRHAPDDWNHVGIVADAGPDVIVTIEGNTNDSGDREGFEVCERLRNYKNKDFITIA